MERDLIIRRILKESEFYTEVELNNYSDEQLYTVLKYCLFIDLIDKKRQKIENNASKSFSSSQYFFLLSDDAIETLDSLCYWRNRISHNGKKVLNYVALEYLVSQRVTPLAIEMYKVEKPAMQDYFPKYLRNVFKIQLLDQLVNPNTKFTYNDFCDPKRRVDMQNNLMYFAHVKELGRASFLSPFALFAPGTYDELHNKPLREKYEKFVKLETKHKDFYKLLICPCCGTKSLVVYRIEFESIFLKKGELDEKFNCRCYGLGTK